MEINLKIPYEKATGSNQHLKAPVLGWFVENRQHQMKYTKGSAESGVYRAWITQLTDDELHGFIEINKARVLRGLDYKTFGPKLEEDYMWRNALYTLELMYREHSGELSQDLYDIWIDQVMSDKQYYEGKLRVALDVYHKNKNKAERNPESSFVTPYY